MNLVVEDASANKVSATTGESRKRIEAMTAEANATRASKSAVATSSYLTSRLSLIGARKTASSRKRANCSDDVTNVGRYR
jgi:hypothetical protein